MSLLVDYLKKIHLGQDLRGEKSDLFYVRDKEKREVDFLTFIDKKIIDLVEVKVSEDSVSSSLIYFKKKLKTMNTTQVVLNLKRELENKGISVQRAENFLAKQES